MKKTSKLTIPKSKRMNKKQLDITPGVEWVNVWAIGSGMTDSQLISEFIDNSIDAGSKNIDILLERNKITIRDDGKGLSSEEEMEIALTTAPWGEKKKIRKETDIGRYGVGAKTAAARLANVMIFNSTSKGNEFFHQGCIDLKKSLKEGTWMADYSSLKKEDKNQHGTILELRALRRVPPRAKKLMEELSVTYAPELRTRKYNIKIQEEKDGKISHPIFCIAPPFPIIEGKKWMIPKTRPAKGKFGVSIHGWVGIIDQTTRNSKEYGFTLIYKAKAFLPKNNKIGIEGLPFKEQRSIVGQFYLNGVPVGSEKVRFDESSREYREVRRLIRSFLKSRKIVQQIKTILHTKEQLSMCKKIDKKEVDKHIQRVVQKARDVGDIENLKSHILSPSPEGQIEQKRSKEKQEQRIGQKADRAKKSNRAKFDKVRNPKETIGKGSTVVCRAGGKRTLVSWDYDFNKNPYDSPKEIYKNGKGVEILINMNYFTINPLDPTPSVKFFIGEAVAETLINSNIAAERRDDLLEKNGG